MKTSFEQNKESIICEYIHNADILKFTLPATLSPAAADILRVVIEKIKTPPTVEERQESSGVLSGNPERGFYE
jgi:hypothetical protein